MQVLRSAARQGGWVAALLVMACGDERAGPQNDAAAPALNAADPAPVSVASNADPAAENARFDAVLDELTRERLRAQPILASYLNVTEAVAGGRYKDRFPEPGMAGYRQRQDLRDSTRMKLESFDPANLSPERQEHLAVLLANSEAVDAMHKAAAAAGYALAGEFNSPYVINQISGVHIDLPGIMTQIHALGTEDDAVAYIARLDQFYEQFEGAIEVLDVNASAGALPPKYALEGAIRNAELFIASPTEGNPLYTHFRDAIQQIELSDRDDLLSAARAAIESSVYPAYEALIGTLRSYLSDANSDAGLWAIPNGSALYEAMIAVNGESELSAEAVHMLGLAEVARIQSEMEAIFAAIDLTEGTVGERLLAITQRADQVFPNTPEGKQQLLSYVRELAAEAEAAMADYFLQTPSTGFEVLPVPDYAEQGAAGGYYAPPAVDGSRPGFYFINLYNTAAQPKFSLPTLTYHEGVPGHHFQLALAVETKQTPLLVRQAASTGGMVEGWALYSEKFAKEIGLYKDDPYGDLGRLRDELFRAVRLVVDSGMHAKTWTREKAIDYMIANAGMDPGAVAREIERYSVWPGQALSYKMGMLKIQALRAKARGALGSDFDVAAFHYQILRDGGAPLEVLEHRIDRWIDQGGPRPAFTPLEQ